MRRTLKKELERVFEAPEPEHKKEFLRTLGHAEKNTIMSLPAFVFSQAGYIRKWVWGISVLIFAVSMTNAVWVSGNMVGVIPAFMPLLALTLVSESGRSESYGMAELEMATRFSLKSVLLARMGILGMENMMILALLFPVGIQKQGLGVLQTGVCILTPYLLMTFSGLYVVRRFRGRETFILCVGIAVGISTLFTVVQRSFPQLYQGNGPVWWGICVLLLGVGTARQCVGIVGETAAV